MNNAGKHEKMRVLGWRLNSKPETQNPKPEIDNPASTAKI